MTALLGEMVGARSEANAASRATASKRITSGPYRGLTQGQVDSMSAQELRDYEKQNEKATGGGEKGGVKRATNDQQLQLGNQFKEALNRAADYAAADKSKRNRAATAKELMKGTTGKDAVPKMGQFPVSLALDMAFDGHISRANAQRLHRLGYKVSDLPGSVSFTDYRKKQAARPKPKPKPKAPTVFDTNPFTGAVGR